MEMMKTENSEKRSVKTLKGQLFGAISMMLVAAIALGTSTYAWFINNQTVEVQNMQLTVSTSTSLLAAVEKQTLGAGDAVEFTGLKSIISNLDITGTTNDGAGWTDFLTTQMIPASTTNALLSGTPTFFMTNNHVSGGKLDEFLAVPALRDVTSVGQGPVKKIGLKFVASNDTKVYLGAKDLLSLADLVNSTNTVKAQEEIDKIADTTEKAAAQKALDQAIAIRKALRVAFVPVGGTPVILQFDSGNSDITGNNTFYNGKTDANASHNETTGNYIGIAAVDANKHVDSVGSLKATVLAAADKAHLATVTADGTVTAPADVTAKELFTVTAGDTGLAVNVYFWLEGTDADCLNALSGYGFNLRLPFAAVPVTPAP